MRPFWPLPWMRSRSAPSSRANLRTEGLACARAKPSSLALGRALFPLGTCSPERSACVAALAAPALSGVTAGAGAGGTAAGASERALGDGAEAEADAGGGADAPAVSGERTVAMRVPADTREPLPTYS